MSDSGSAMDEVRRSTAAPTGNKRKSTAPGEEKPLKRNTACLNCRSRKLKCDGLHPVCTTCAKSLRYALEHLKNGVPPPPCEWEDSIAGPSGSKPNKVATKRARKSAGSATGGGSPVPTGLATPANPTRPSSTLPNASYPSAVPHASHNAYAAGYVPSAAPGPSTATFAQPRPLPRPPGHHVDTFPPSIGASDQIPRASSALEDAHTLASLPWLFGPDSPPPPHSHADTFPPRAPPPSVLSARPPSDQRLLQSSSGGCVSATPPLPAESPSMHLFGPPPSFSYVAPSPAAHPASNTVVSSGIDPPTFHGTTAEMVQRTQIPSTSAIDTVFSDLCGVSHRALAAEPGSSPAYFPSPAMSARADKGKGRAEPEVFGIGSVLPFSQADMTALFWPGWPPHLPAPDKMHRIVEIFFGCAHMASNIVNKSKLLHRLSLPPTHHDFPHPAVLHAICAASSRFLGDVYIEPAATAAFPDVPAREQYRNALSAAGSGRPTWDGIGRRPASARTGVDSDFGEVHATYATLYVEDSIGDASSWMPIVQASTLLAHYYVQNAKWSAGCLMSARAIRMLTPLGLHLREIPPEASRLFVAPSDGIEISERRNLFWSLFAVDTLSSAASGWAGCLDDRVVTCPIPSCDASSASTSDDGSHDSHQPIHGFRVFHEHPPGVTSNCLMFKSILLLRRVHEFLRLAKTLELSDPRESSDFRRLDALLSSFRQSLPAEYRNPVRPLPSALMNAALDLDLLMVHVCSLASVIQLHETFARSKDSDYSLLRMLAAARGVIGIVHQLAATSFDFSRLPPFASFVFFLAARSSTHVLRRAVNRGDCAIESACRSEIDLLRAAMDQVGLRLPIGVRTSNMCSTILRDIGVTSEVSDVEAPANTFFEVMNRDFTRSFGSSKSSTAGNELNVSVIDHAMEERICQGTPLGDTKESSREWAEQLALEVEEERQALGASLESMWTGADTLLFEQTLRAM